MELLWKTSVRTSALWAAWQLSRRRVLIDAQLATTLQPVALGWAMPIGGPRLAEAVWQQLLPLSFGDLDDQALAETAMRSTNLADRGDVDTEAVAQVLARLNKTYAAALPQLVAELPLRLDPLRWLWEARGPGLLAAMRRFSEPGLLVESAQIVLVQPCLGGGGAAWADDRSVTFEALLANPQAALPEVLRLGWLLAQLNLEQPAWQEAVGGPANMARVGPLALIPLALEAGEQVELNAFDDKQIRLALDNWLGAGELAPLLADWWKNCQKDRPDWPAALAALSAELASQSAALDSPNGTSNLS